MEIDDWEYQQLVAKLGLIYDEIWRLDISDKFYIKRDKREDLTFFNFHDLLTWIMKETAEAEKAQPASPSTKELVEILSARGGVDREDIPPEAEGGPSILLRITG